MKKPLVIIFFGFVAVFIVVCAFLPSDKEKLQPQTHIPLGMTCRSANPVRSTVALCVEYASTHHRPISRISDK